MPICGLKNDKVFTSFDGEVRWTLPEFYVRALFQKRFWETVVPRDGAKALELPKILGQRLGPRSGKTCVCSACKSIRSEIDERITQGNKPREDWMELDVYNAALAEWSAEAEDESEGDGLMEEIGGRVDEKRAEREKPKSPCEAFQLAYWTRPRGKKDPRRQHEFGLADGKYRSLPEGTVVRKENYRELFELECSMEKLTVLDAIDSMHPDDRAETKAREERIRDRAVRKLEAEEAGYESASSKKAKNAKPLRKRRSAEWWGLSV